MGWPLAVSAGLMERSSRALIAALWPLAVGHLLAMLVVMLPFAFLAALVEWQRQIRIGASLLVIAFGIFRLVNRRHPRALARIPPTQLGLWSFAVAIAHGAGFMLVPIYLGLCRAADLDSGHEAAGALINGNLGMAVLVSLVHGAAMIAAGGALCMVSLPLPWSQIRVAELVQSRYRMGPQPRRNRRALIRVQPLGSVLTTSRSTERHLGVRTPRNASTSQSRPYCNHSRHRDHAIPIGADGDHWPRTAGRRRAGVDQDRTDSSASSRRHAASSRSGLNKGARRATAR